MYEQEDSILWKRIKSLMWRSAMMGLAASIAAIASNISSLDFNPAVTAVLGLALGEVSKYLNTMTS